MALVVTPDVLRSTQQAIESALQHATAIAQKNTRPQSRCAALPLRTASAAGAIKKPMNPAVMCR